MADILLIETSTMLCSVGIARNGELLAIRENDSSSHSHAEQTNVFIEQVGADVGIPLDKLHAVAVGAGPGSYTGLRIGNSVAKGLCYALDIPLIGISSLHTIAQGMLSTGVKEHELLIPMIDARRNEVFTAVLDRSFNEIQPMHPLVLDEAGYATLPSDEWAVGGNGAFKVDHANADLIEGITTSVKWMAPLAESRFQLKKFDDLAYFVPDYGKAAQPTKAKKR